MIGPFDLHGLSGRLKVGPFEVSFKKPEEQPSIEDVQNENIRLQQRVDQLEAEIKDIKDGH